jgi:fumarate hydratase class II
MANDVAVGFGGAGGWLKMNIYTPLMTCNMAQSITPLTEGCTNFCRFLVEGARPNVKKICKHVERSLPFDTALAPVIGYDEASKIAHHAMNHDQTLRQTALEPSFVTEEEFDRIVDARKMVTPYVATDQ